MSRVLVLLYGVVSYLIFLVAFLYAIGFITNFLVPKGIDAGEVRGFAEAVLINIGLLSVFAIQHSVMARPGFKQRWTKVIAKPIERSTYVLLTSLILFLLFWQWRPLAGIVWGVQSPIGVAVLWGICAVGFGVVLISTFLIDHFDLFGLRQVVFYFRGKPYEPPRFKVRLFYRFSRHPLMVGFMIAFWATPRMTVGHLLFAIVTTAYILIAIQLEERDLAAAHGEDYEAYRRQVSMLLPLPPKSVATDASEEG